jgi:CAAX prenyl protease-like protein
MNRKTLAYVLPFAVFLLFLAIPGVVAPLLKNWSPLLGEHPRLIVWPIQTAVCAIILIWFWREYDWSGTFNPLWALGIGALCFALWIAPSYLLPGFAPRIKGFNPDVLQNEPALWWLTVLSRFVRLAIVVPLLEEIFWRGFLMRYLIKSPEFETVKIGTYSALSFWVVAALFALEHEQVDWVAAFATGILFNLVAVRTKSLSSCVVAHATTNLCLGLYVMATQQWGYW